MAIHDGHVLQVALPTLVAYRAVVRVAGHQPLGHTLAEGLGLGVFDGDANPIIGGREAGHDDLSLAIVLILELLDGALAAGAHRTHGRVPAEVGKVESKRQAYGQEILTGGHFECLIVYVDSRHGSLSPVPRRRERTDTAGRLCAAECLPRNI